MTTRRFHLIGAGLQRSVSWDRELSEVIDEIHEQGGVAIAAHPGRMYWDAYDRVLEKLDAAEVVHPAVYLGRREGALSYEQMVEFYEARRSHIAAIGSSDYHAFKALGVCRTLLFVDSLSREGVLDAIRARRTVTYAPDGRAFGDPTLIAALEQSPVEVPSVTSYEVDGAVDLFGRLMGLLGLVGFVFLASPLYESSAFQSSSNVRQKGETNSS